MMESAIHLGPAIREPRRASRCSHEETLVLRMQNGDCTAFELLVNSYKSSVSNYAARTLGDATEAQDIAQIVFVKVFRSVSHFHFRSTVSTWIFTITRNLCINELRRRARHRFTPFEDRERTGGFHAEVALRAASQSDPNDAVVNAELAEKIEEALADLPERQRTAILLLREHDLSYEEIASVLRVSVPATKALIYCGRKELKKRLRPYLRTGAWKEFVRGRPTECSVDCHAKRIY